MWDRRWRKEDVLSFEDVCLLLQAEGGFDQQLDVLREAKRRGVVDAPNGVIRFEILASAIGYLWRSHMVRHATHHLAHRYRHYSARQRTTSGQGFFWLAALVAVSAVATWHFWWVVSVAAMLGLAMLFTLTVPKLLSLRHFAATRPARFQPFRPRTAHSQDTLPIYTILIPLFREIDVLKPLLRGLLEIRYPAQCLDIKLLVEEEDIALIDALAELNLPSHIQMVVIPAVGPQTKPKALNYGLQLALGAYLTVYDAEDIPEPGQLLCSVAAFSRCAPNVACLQAQLLMYNRNENWLTGQFALEYAVWFDGYLPTLARERWPLPLGGTSNHFRTDVIRKIGGWDPFNVTEDADLGFRIARAGYRVEVLPSRTYEEAPCNFRVWLKQRARWIKGYMQTALVHSRRPRLAIHRLGFWSWWFCQCLTFGSVITTLLHPFLMIGFLATVATADLTSVASVVGITFLALSYALNFALGWILSRRNYGSADFFALATFPIYWMLLGLPALLALFDFVFRPHHWHKTQHGQSRLVADATSLRP